MKPDQVQKWLLGTVLHVQIGTDQVDDAIGWGEEITAVRGTILDGPLAGTKIEIPIPDQLPHP